MKKQLVSLIALASMFVIAGCGSNADSGSVETSENPTETVKPTETTKPTEPATPTPTPTEPATTDKDTEAPAPAVPEIVETTIDALTENVPADANLMYKVSGIWKHTGTDTDAFGNGDLIDTTSGNALVIYGMSPDNTAFTYKEGDGFTFTNPQKFQDITIATGDKITLGVVYSARYKNYYSYFISKDADKSAFTYNVEIGTFENGTVTADKTSGISGDKVTLTVTPATDYAVEFVKLNDVAIVAEEGVYSFAIVPGKNVITAGFVSSVAPITKMTIDTNNGAAFGTAYPKGNATVEIVDGRNTVTFDYTNLFYSASNLGLQSKIDMYLYNTTEFAGEIESVEFTPSAKWTSDTSALSISFGTAAITEKPTDTKFAGTILKAGAKIDCSVAGAKYLRIDHTVKGMVVISKLVINFKS